MASNQDIITLVSAGCDAKLIRNFIAEDNAPSYALDVTGLAALADAKVPTEVVQAMQFRAKQKK